MRVGSSLESLKAFLKRHVRERMAVGIHGVIPPEDSQMPVPERTIDAESVRLDSGVWQTYHVVCALFHRVRADRFPKRFKSFDKAVNLVFGKAFAQEPTAPSKTFPLAFAQTEKDAAVLSVGTDRLREEMRTFPCASQDDLEVGVPEIPAKFIVAVNLEL